MLKKLFGGGSSQKTTEANMTIDDLIVLERYDEAATRLQAKLKSSPSDLHSRLKLGEVYFSLRQGAKAVDEFIFVAEEYAHDGFHDKAIALLTKAMKLAPADTTLPLKIEKIKNSKRLEHSRVQAIDALLQRTSQSSGSATAGTSALELQRLWGNLEESRIVRRLDADQLRRLFGAMDFARIGEDVIFIERGQSLEALYLIVEGTVEAALPRLDGGWSILRTFSSGDIIGDRALLERKPWPAFYRTDTTVTYLKLERAGLEQAMVGSSDPRGFLDALREMHHDADVATLAYKVGA